MESAFNAIVAHGSASSERHEVVDTWRRKQYELSHHPECTFDFSPEDVRQAGLSGESATRSGEAFQGSIPRHKLAADVLEERLDRAISLQKRINWAFIDVDSVELIEDFINALSSEDKNEDDKRVMSWYWRSGLTIDVTMELEELRKVMEQSGKADTPSEYTVDLKEKLELSAMDEELVSDSAETETFKYPPTPRQRQSSQLFSTKREFAENATQPSISSKRAPLGPMPRRSPSSGWSEAFTPFLFRESYERSHIRSQAEFNLKDGPVRTSEEQLQKTELWSSEEKERSVSQTAEGVSDHALNSVEVFTSTGETESMSPSVKVKVEHDSSSIEFPSDKPNRSR